MKCAEIKQHALVIGARHCFHHRFIIIIIIIIITA